MTADTKTPPSSLLPEEFSSIPIEEEMKRSYLDYAMSVIVSRALPDVRDGLKPVHRRILFSMHENGFEWNKPYRKSARVVGDVIGRFHPHGDQAIYDSLVRMTQDFAMSLPLLDGQGNFGSVDGDAPAAMRYTETRMARSSHYLLADIEKETVNYQKNYDNTELEPCVLPAGFPNILVNGGTGIAVGMATNIPPHNPTEVINACLALLDNPELSFEELNEIIPGPDFPTGGLIIGRGGIRSCYKTGRGSIVMRAIVAIEEMGRDKKALVISAIPYGINKVHLIEKIAELVREKRIEGIAELRDESDRSGMRVVIELKREASAEVILNQLYRFSQLQSNFPANMLTLNNGRPELMDLISILKAFLVFREQVITRRTKFELGKARDRAHILVALSIAVAHIDRVVSIIRSASNTEAARNELMRTPWAAADMRMLIDLIADPRSQLEKDDSYLFSLEQAQAILDLRLQRLTALGRDEINNDLKTLADKIAHYLHLLSHRDALLDLMRQEFVQVRNELNVARRTEILDLDEDFEDDDLIPMEDIVITISHGGYVKRVPLSSYKAQRRGGKGRSGMTTKEDDFVGHLLSTTTHNDILFFSSKGLVYKLKAWRLPTGSLQSKGKAFVNLLPLQPNERITSVLALPLPAECGGDNAVDLVFATRKGYVRRNRLTDFMSINRSGKIAMKFEEQDDEIMGVVLCHQQNEDIFLATAQGRCIRFCIDKLRVFSGRTSTGVRGIRLSEGDTVISLTTLTHVEASPEEVRAYIKQSKLLQRQQENLDSEAEEEEIADEEDEELGDEKQKIIVLSNERFEELKNQEQFILTVSENGFGKRSSAYEYRATNRGGKGITAMTMTKRNGRLVAAIPVVPDNEVILATDGGTILRCLVYEIRLIGRMTQGVIILRTGANEKIVSVDSTLLEKIEPSSEV